MEVSGDFWQNNSAEPWGQKPEGNRWGTCRLYPFRKLAREKGGAKASGLKKSFFLGIQEPMEGKRLESHWTMAPALYLPSFPLSFFSLFKKKFF